MERFLERFGECGLAPWYDDLAAVVKDRRNFLDNAKGNFLRFKTVVEAMPALSPKDVDLDGRYIRVGEAAVLDADVQEQLLAGLKGLCPWRKGPFEFFGIEVDAEWQSWMKWERLFPHLPPLAGRRILDIGSSNGYYMFKMAAQNPTFVLGLEPQSSFYYQYQAVQKYLKHTNVFCLPIPYHQLPVMEAAFDLVLCMGILYHRKSPVKMLSQIRESLRPGGQIVVENLVIEGERNLCLFPHDRYAKMRNVFFIPDLAAMISWLDRAGFKEIRCVDVSTTSIEEQRKTDWIQTESLADFLNPDDPCKTVEGYPAPVRAIFLARV
ncbi:MAG: tRNA 5-methoxyuridine(34)/uridine 5-oxyacetic acid(34) synthase CmoB [Desulfobacterales bacterium]|nr:MAG: tRNA 5-methoxyuridine(34)/uridine 5-oxyacetic acid(34) synthase CmoB [Desulfobacterales bacterium]